MNGGHGAEILELRAHLKALSGSGLSAPGTAGAHPLQGELKSRVTRLHSLDRRRDALLRDWNWVESSINGFERALLLFDDPDAGIDALDGEQRLQQRLTTHREEASVIAADLAEIEKCIRDVEARVLHIQEQLVKLLRHNHGEAERARTARRQAWARRRAEQQILATTIEQDAMWSPVAVLAYRIWEFKKGGMYGARHQWRDPHMVATCFKGDGVPHTDGRCTTVAYGCGIYATKAPQSVMDTVRSGKSARVAVGLVGLEGRLVEHETGYRAERATILSLAIVDRGRVRTIDEPEAVQTMLESPTKLSPPGAAWLPVASATKTLRAGIADYLKKQARRYETWTSATPNE